MVKRFAFGLGMLGCWMAASLMLEVPAVEAGECSTGCGAPVATYSAAPARQRGGRRLFSRVRMVSACAPQVESSCATGCEVVQPEVGCGVAVVEDCCTVPASVATCGPTTRRVRMVGNRSSRIVSSCGTGGCSVPSDAVISSGDCCTVPADAVISDSAADTIPAAPPADEPPAEAAVTET